MFHPFPRTWWISADRLLGGCFPGSFVAEEVDVRLTSLLDAGVTDVICLQEEGEVGRGGRPFTPYLPRLQALAGERGQVVSWARFPVRDMTAPSVDVTRSVLDRIHGNRGVTYVHCWGGHGRTGAVAGCWLREQGLSADEALESIRASRSHDSKLAIEPSPQTADQHARIRGWVPASRQMR